MGHGMSKTKQYVAYLGIKQRCNNPKHRAYKWYGGRGVKFLLPDFAEFWRIMGPSWFEGASLDRIDNKGHYEIGNVRWATYKEQSRNKSNNVLIEYNGERMIAGDWAERLGVTRETVRDRLKRWGASEAVTKPAKKAKLVTYQGRTQTIKDWAAESGVHVNTLTARLKTWPVERALNTEVKDVYKNRPRRKYIKE